MNLSYYNLFDGFNSIGLKKGDSVVVHSSLSSLGYVEGGETSVIKAIMNVISEEGTLIVPTLTGKIEDSILNPPIFDVRYTASWTGRIAESVRKMEGSIRSLHPTHSAAAIGENKFLITQEHEKSFSPCDKWSPYYKNALNRGYILLIGVDLESNTSIHSCEEIAEVPYHLQKEITNSYITDYNGEKILVSNRLHDWGKPRTDFNKLEDLYIQNDIMRIFNVGNAKVRLINSFNMFSFTIELLKKDPLFLLCNSEHYR